MNLDITWPAIGVIVAVICHAFFTVWSAATFKATISAKIDNLVSALQRMDRELEKRDQVMSAAWKKLDSLNDRLVRVETKSGIGDD